MPHDSVAGHGTAVLGTLPASSNAAFHATDACAVVSARRTGFRTQAAQLAVKLALMKHEICGGRADHSTIHHQAKMLWLCVVATFFQAVGHCRAQTDFVALETSVNAGNCFATETVELGHMNAMRCAAHWFLKCPAHRFLLIVTAMDCGFRPANKQLRFDRHRRPALGLFTRALGDVARTRYDIICTDSYRIRIVGFFGFR
jgi:hypothetical protein